MQPVLSVAEMAAADKAAQDHIGLERLIARAGTAVAVVATEMLGGAYGRRVLVVAGRGHNGDDGRVAAAHLRRRGARVQLVAPGAAPERVVGFDLVIDAAFGTGFHGEYRAPGVEERIPVLAVDVPSGLDADSGRAGDGAVRATTTVTFEALKTGLLLGRGPELAGRVVLAPIGLPLPDVGRHLVDDGDVDAALPRRPRSAHKWQSAVYVLAGSPGMLGAAVLSVRGALRAGAGMVRIGSPGAPAGAAGVTEAVGQGLPSDGFAPLVAEELRRCRALVVGPGLGTAPATASEIRRLVADAACPVLVDADGLGALGNLEQAARVLKNRKAASILTPHEGEFARLTGAPPGDDRVGAVVATAEKTGAVVLLKGSTTTVAAPNGQVWFSTSGSSRLATAGSGDVLSGVIGAFLARGIAAPLAAVLGAHVHGRAASLGRDGLISGDLPDLVAAALEEMAP